MFWVTIDDPNIAIKKGSSIFDTHFNRKFTSDCPTQHLWNCPICNFDVPTILGEVYVIENGGNPSWRIVFRYFNLCFTIFLDFHI